MRRSRRIVRRTQGKDPRVMCASLITSSKDGGINLHTVVEPTITSGSLGTGHVFEGADFKTECSPNSLIKYFNLRLECAIKSEEAEFRPGWIEYGLIQYENEAATPTVPAGVTSNFGTQTLPELLRNNFRNHCIWTGAEPISVELPRVIDLHIKLPGKYCKNQRGTFWMFFYAFRSSKSTDTVTTVKNIMSHEYKVYI